MRASLLALLLLPALPAGLLRAEEAHEAVVRWQVSAQGPGFLVPKDLPSALAGGFEAHLDGIRLPVLRTGPEGEPTILVPRLRGGRRGPTPIALVPAEGALPAAVDPRSTGPLPGTADHLPRWIRHDADVIHAPVPAARPSVYAGPLPSWVLAVLEAGGDVQLVLSGDDAAPGRPQRLHAHVLPSHRGEVRLRALWGPFDLGVARTRIDPTTGIAPPLTWPVPAGRIPPDDAPLVLRDVSVNVPDAPPRDVSEARGHLALDALALEGMGRVAAGPRLGAWSVHGGSAPIPGVHLQASAMPWAVLLDPEGAVRPIGLERLAEPEDTWQIAIPQDAPPGSTLFLQGTPARPTVTPLARSADPMVAALEAEHLIVAIPPLVEAMELLAAHRRAEGLPSQVVDAQAIWNHHGQGDPDATVLRAFLQARRNAGGDARPLRHVLLVGDAALDRGDRVPWPTLPVGMVRTMYNGATATDALFAEAPGSDTPPPQIGRLPFQRPETARAFVERLMRYEQSPPVHVSRRTLRFVTSEGRFGPQIDTLIENLFRGVLARAVPLAYDVEVTYANPRSPFLWPPAAFNDKVIAGLDAGALFYTYVGHGFAQGFDQLHVGRRRYPILTVREAPDVSIQGTPPVVFVLACTTAKVDGPRREGIGEVLMQNPQGPIAYWGATRICHPAANALVGHALALEMGRASATTRLGDLIEHAWRYVEEKERRTGADARAHMLIRLGVKAFLEDRSDAGVARLVQEGRWMYSLLGDPATRLALPANDLEIHPAAEEDGVLAVTVKTPLPDGTEVHVALERTRDRSVHPTTPVPDPLAPGADAVIRENHRKANDRVVQGTTLRVAAGQVQWTVTLPEDRRGLLLKAWALGPKTVHHGAVRVP